jgi:hypothetical protein
MEELGLPYSNLLFSKTTQVNLRTQQVLQQSF